MQLLNRLRSGRYISSIEPGKQKQLKQIQSRMMHYYQATPYHSEWIKGINTHWRTGQHDAQIAMTNLIHPGSTVLEIGCGDGSAVEELTRRVEMTRYVGIDLNTTVWPDKYMFTKALAHALPFQPQSFDVVLSMFVIEHLVFPTQFLDEAWRLIRPSGRLLLIAPDFTSNGMASERIGLSYGSGRSKIRQCKFFDALLTAYDTRVRIPIIRLLRLKQIRKGKLLFPILTRPRCLYLSGFTPDCDAIHPACPEEILSYMANKQGHKEGWVFYRSRSTFGLVVQKHE